MLIGVDAAPVKATQQLYIDRFVVSAGSGEDGDRGRGVVKAGLGRVSSGLVHLFSGGVGLER
jgi:hypothetical protein